MRSLVVLLVVAACAGTQEEFERVPGGPVVPEEPRSWKEDFVDDEDGKLDVSNFLERDLGFLPLVVPITEPALGGFGLIGALAFFHDKEPEPGVEPTFSAVLGGATTNETWLAGVAHQNVWGETGKNHYLGVFGYADINLDFFGVGARQDQERSTDLNFQGFFTSHEFQRRIGDSKFFWGVDYLLTDIQTTIDFIVPIRRDFTSSGVGAYVKWQTIDNHFTPNRGVDIDLGVRFYAQALGSDDDYQKARLHVRSWWPLGDRVVLGVRFDVEGASDGAPLFDLPFVRLRGVPAFRYVDSVAAAFELEPRIRITDRWFVVVFGGVGQTAGTLSDITNDDVVLAGGFGFRYLLARRRGILAGIDVAYSDEEAAFYITVGSAWSF